MDNNNIDKILKEKLKNHITPPKEVQEKVIKTINKQKEKAKKQNVKSKRFVKMRAIASMVAVALIAVTLGIYIKNNGLNFKTTEITSVTIKNIEPTKSSNQILSNDSEFIIEVEGEKVNAQSVQKVLYIEPALEYTIKKTSNPNQYKLTFKQNIPSNTIVKLQYVKDQITENSWAYQTSDELVVNETYPENGTYGVSKNSVIEIEFSYASIENLENYVEISPAIEGKWEHLGKVWRFTPANKLAEQEYYVKVKSGITTQQKTLKDDYIFRFRVAESYQEQYRYNTISIDGINTYKPDEPVRIYCEDVYDEERKLNISKLEIAKFETKDDFIEYLQNKDYKKATNFTKYEFEQTTKFVQLSQGLQEGFYVAVIYGANNKEMFNCPIQINELSAYAMETERDVIVWVANGKNLAKNIQVEYQGKTQKTDSQGLAEFKDVADNSKTIKYLSLGNTQNQLVVGIYNYSLDNYPKAYLYTDRPLYKSTDTINIWAFIPLKNFYDKVQNEFYIELDEEGKQKVNVDENGNLNYSINLNNHNDTNYSTIKLYYKDTIIGIREIMIENYELQNYSYDVIANRNYVYAGEKYEFDVKVNHITGLVVPNKKVRVEYFGKIYTEITGENGIAHFAIDIEADETESSNPNGTTITIKNGDGEEYTDKDYYKEIFILSRDVYVDKQENEDAYTVDIYKLAKDKDINVSYDLSNIYDGTYNTNVHVELEETAWTRELIGYNYNEYTKQNEPQYKYNPSSNTQNIKTVNTQNEKLKINKNDLKLKEDTEEVYYTYVLIYTLKDTLGRNVREIQDVYFNDELNNRNVGYFYVDSNSSDSLSDMPQAINAEAYYSYRYLLQRDLEKFSIGDTVNFTLAESTNSGIKNIQNSGKILELVFKENIMSKEIIEESKFSYKFNEKDFPGCTITTAYFYEGNFYRMPIYYFDFNEEDRKVDIQITRDKEKYAPGDDVTLTVKTTNNGKPIKSFVNISVVNEAIFALVEDEANILSTIYEQKPYPVYTYSSYIDYIQGQQDGGGGGGGLLRSNFGDTAYFKTVNTDSKGTATVTFKLPDNVTTYRVTAQSANKDLYVGINTTDIVSTLDFFIQFTEPRNVKTTDDLVLNATSVANSIYNVDYEFTIKELNKTLTASANTNSIATVNFGKLPYGTYTVNITGKCGEQTDAALYTINIIESAQEVKSKTTVPINSDVKITPTKNPIVLEIYHKNMEQYLKYIDFIESTVTNRLDTQIAYIKAQEIKDRYYNTGGKNYKLDLSQYLGEKYLKNLPNGKEDLVLSALISYYTDGYLDNRSLMFNNMDNLFETYLFAAASKEPVLIDLLHLKDEPNIANYNKLLVTLSLEFLGDFENAKELYNEITLTNEEAEEYKSIVAIIETFINKQNAVIKINELMESKPADEYLRFAILSFFENNSSQIEAENEVKVVSKNLNRAIKLNGMQIQTLTINSEELSNIKFETSSNDVMVSYYYQTLLDNVEDQNISKDISIRVNGELKKDNEITLVVNFTKQFEGPVKIALPNSLRLAEDYSYNENKKYYLQNNNIDYVTYFKQKECSIMEIKLLVTCEGNYKFENIVCNEDGIYHLSNSLDINISK